MLKSVACFVAGAAVATVVIGRSIQDELPDIISKKIVRGVEKGEKAIERWAFGEELSSRRSAASADLKHRYYRSSTYGIR